LEGVGIVLALLIISLVGHSMSMVYTCVILLLLKWLLPQEAVDYVGQHGAGWGVILLTVALLVPLIQGKVGLNEIRNSFTGGLGLLAVLIGLMVAIFGRWGITLIGKTPQITIMLMVGTVIGVIFFKGVAVGPMIAGGITYAILTILEGLGIR
jgi:uncharacterized membrane protein (DUF441 family)